MSRTFIFLKIAPQRTLIINNPIIQDTRVSTRVWWKQVQFSIIFGKVSWYFGITKPHNFLNVISKITEIAAVQDRKFNSRPEVRCLFTFWPDLSSGQLTPLMKETMSQLYLCEEPYWSKYDQSDICTKALQINVISDGK